MFDVYVNQFINAEISALRKACQMRGLITSGHRALILDRLKKHLSSNEVYNAEVVGKPEHNKSIEMTGDETSRLIVLTHHRHIFQNPSA